MHLIELAILVAVTGPPGTEPGGDPVGVARDGSIGVVWHDQATVAPDEQQRLADELVVVGAIDREALVLEASAVAAARIALELPRVRVEEGIAWLARLDDAVRAYRAGELERAQEGLEALLGRVREDPVIPGAAVVAWRAHVLRGQLAWAQGDTAGLDAAVAAAVVLDPQARLSTRQVPPSVAEAYERQRAAILAEASRWPSLSVTTESGEPFAVEIDGVPGQRPVPPGEHLVVVRRPGRAPVGAVVESPGSWSLPQEPRLLEPGLPRTREAAQRLCRSASLSWVLLARVRDGRMGLQRYTCGEGFGPAWYEQHDGIAPGLRRMLEVPEQGWEARPVLHRSEPWPPVSPRPSAVPLLMTVADESTRTPRARLRRALPWLIIGGVVAGAVTVGVVVGADPGANLAVDGNSFLRP